MSQNNFVIQDVVTHVYREDDYRSPKIIINTFKKLISKSWIFLLILALSAGIGYVAVYLPDSIAKKAESLGGIEGLEGLEGLPKELQGLSDEQKKELYERYKGGGK